MKKFKLLSVAVLCIALVLSACGGGGTGGGQDVPVTLAVGNIQSMDDVATAALHRMSELAYEKSGGTITIEVFPASQLGSAISQIEAVSLGSQAMFQGSGTWLATYVPDRGAAGMFFVFNDRDHFVNYVQSDLMVDVEEQFREELGIVIVANNWIIAPRSMASTVPINTVGDLHGLRFRVPDIRAYLDSVNALGASPVQIAFGETYLAMIQGVVDVTEAPFDNLYTMNFYEAGQYIIMTEHIYDNYVVMINEDIFNNLSPNQQEALRSAAVEAGVFFNDELANILDTFTQNMRDGGATFIYVDNTSFAQAAEEKIRQLEAEGEWRAGLFDEIRALQR